MPSFIKDTFQFSKKPSLIFDYYSVLDQHINTKTDISFSKREKYVAMRCTGCLNIPQKKSVYLKDNTLKILPARLEG